MFKFLFYGLLGICALMIYSWISLFFLPVGSTDGLMSNKRNTGLITLLFCAVAALVFYFQMTQKQGAANLTLYGFYALLLLVTLWTIRTGRWN